MYQKIVQSIKGLTVTNRLALGPRLDSYKSSCLPGGNITIMGKCDPFTEESTQYHEFEAIKKVIWTPQIEILNLVKVCFEVVASCITNCAHGGFFQTIDRDIVNTKVVSRIDVCSGSVIVFKFTRFKVYCSLKYHWYPFDTQVSKMFNNTNRYGTTICKAHSQCYRYVPSLSNYTT